MKFIKVHIGANETVVIRHAWIFSSMNRRAKQNNNKVIFAPFHSSTLIGYRSK